MISAKILQISGRNAVAGVSSSLSRNKHTLPDLPYDYNALEPVISAEIMKIHHQKHHNTYVTNLNEAEEKAQEALHKGCANMQIKAQSAIRFNGGGHINHSIFWTNLAPKSGGEPSGQLMEAIKRDFGSFDQFKTKLTTDSVAVQGSGWGWLGYNPVNKRLQVITMPNQDPLFPLTGMTPLLGIDVWEHAYYLQYKSARADYVKEIWKIINWKNVEERYGKALSGK
jgi:Fe-Mn family superoxide dismutase